VTEARPDDEPLRDDPDARWDAVGYDAGCSYVWAHGKGLVELLAARPGERVLDLGCGTGWLTASISEAGADVLGVDNSAEMIRHARENHPELGFEVADGADLPYDSRFDAVFSNAALHWIHPPERAVEGIARALRVGGRLVAEFGGRGNVAQVLAALNDELAAAARTDGVGELQYFNPWYFPGVVEYGALLQSCGLEPTYLELFDRPTELTGGEDGLRTWLAMFASAALDPLRAETRARILAGAEERLAPRFRHNGVWTVDYRRLRVVAYKPAS